jgi:hypothetical protein
LQAQAGLVTKVYLDALGDDYAAYCQGAHSDLNRLEFIVPWEIGTLVFIYNNEMSSQGFPMDIHKVPSFSILCFLLGPWGST